MRGIVFLSVMLVWASVVFPADLISGRLVSERPDFGPDQIRSKEKLFAGMWVQWCHTGKTAFCEKPMQVLGKPIQENQEKPRVWWFSALKPGAYGTFISDYSLADCGVLPYEDNQWNPTNWLKRVVVKDAAPKEPPR